MEKQICHRRPLSTGSFCSVELCDCGSLHLSIGAVTLRLAPDALAAIAEVVGEGARELALMQTLAAHRAARLEALS